MSVSPLAARVALLLGLVSVAASASAEVRVRAARGGAETALDLEVRPTARGLWQPTGQADARILNPHGDLTGDGMPGWVGAPGQVWASWLRPLSSQVLVAWSDGARWTEPFVAEAGGAVGTPRVLHAGDSVAALWQRVMEGGQSDVVLTAWSAEGLFSESWSLADGWLVGLAVFGDRFDVISLHDDGELRWQRFRFDSLRPVPQPIDVDARALDWLASVDGGDERLRLATPQVHELRSADADAPARLLTWWASPQELSFVELAAAGPVLPIESLEHPGQADRPQSLVRRALRLVAERHD